MIFCPNKNSKEFQELSSLVGENQAYFLWNEYKGEVPKSVYSNIKEGVENIFVNNPELFKIGTQEQYSQYLDTIFPDSKIKDIIYHGTNKKFDKFDDSKRGSRDSGLYGKAHYFSKAEEVAYEFYGRKNKKPLAVIVNSSNPFIETKEHNYEKDVFHILDNNSEYDSATDNKHQIEIAIRNSNQIHILGSKQDIEGFKNYVNNKPKFLTQENNNSVQNTYTNHITYSQSLEKARQMLPDFNEKDLRFVVQSTLGVPIVDNTGLFTNIFSTPSFILE